MVSSRTTIGVLIYDVRSRCQYCTDCTDGMVRPTSRSTRRGPVIESTHRLHRQSLRALIALRVDSDSGPLRMTSVLYIIIESGVTYTLLWVVYVCTGQLSDAGSVYSDFWMCQISVRDLSCIVRPTC